MVKRNCLILFLLSIGVFAHSIRYDFTFDDGAHILTNLEIRKIDNISRFFSEATHPGNLFRPIPMVSYALTHAAFGLNPWPYHLTNILLHAAVTVLVFLTLRLLLIESTAVLASLFFAVLPIHVEVVANVSNRTELLPAFFGLAASYLWLRLDIRTVSPRGIVFSWISSVTLFLLAFLSKESALSFIWLLPLALVQRFGIKEATQRGLLPGAALAVSLLCYFVLRFNALDGFFVADYQIPLFDNSLVQLPAVDRLLPALVLLGRYLLLSLIPYQLSVDYSYQKTQPFINWGDPVSIISLGLILSLILLTLKFRKRQPALGFFTAWYLLSFLITSNIFFVIGTVFAERLSYLPSIATCGLLALFFSEIQDVSVRRFLVLAYAIACILLTVVQTTVWRNNVTLFSREISISENSAKVQHYYGLVLLDEHRPVTASRHFHQALKLYPRYPQPAYGLGQAWLIRRNMRKGVYWLKRCLTLDPHFVPALNLLGRVRLQQRKIDEAGELFKEALNYDNSDYDAMLGALTVAIEKGNIKQARVFSARLKERNPESPELRRLETAMQDLWEQTPLTPNK